MLKNKEYQLDEIRNNLKSKFNDNEDTQGISDIRAELKAEKKFHSTLKDLEMKTIEADTEKLSILKEKKILEKNISKLKQEIEFKDEQISDLNKKYEVQFKDASNRFSEEFNDLNLKIEFLKEEVEKYREYKIKFEFIEKDYKGNNMIKIKKRNVDKIKGKS